LTVNAHVVTNGVTMENFLYPNGPNVMGMLDKAEGYYTEECFPVASFSSEKYKILINII